MSSPRIITGSSRGVKLFVPQNGTRPMTDRVKSALFSIINFNIIDSEILDLFAGSGALGIECLSRGAKKATFIDKSPEAVECIHKNLEKTGLKALGNVIKSSVDKFSDQNINSLKFDIIFYTPPYILFKEKNICKVQGFLKKNSILIVEFPSKLKLKDKIDKLIKFDERRYGITGIAFYKLL